MDFLAPYHRKQQINKLLKAFASNGRDQKDGITKEPRDVQVSLAFHANKLGLTSDQILNLTSDPEVLEKLGSAGFYAHLEVDAPPPTPDGIVKGLRLLAQDLAAADQPWKEQYAEILRTRRPPAGVERR